MALDRIVDRARLRLLHRNMNFVDLANRAREARQWALAARLYRKALDRDPHSPPIWVQYGHALKESGELRDPDKLAQAEVAYRRALSIDPGAADPHLHLGHVLKLQGKTEEAEASYLRALALDPSMPYPLRELNELGWSEGQISELRGMLGADMAGPLAPASVNSHEGPPEGSCIGSASLTSSESEDAQLILHAELFDAVWYLEKQKDVRDAGVNPLLHYLRFGAAEGRDPNRLFDSDWYLAANPDVAAAGMNPLVHYARSGAAEGRAPHPLFDTVWYLKMNPDVAASGINPLAHYLSSGASEGRAPDAVLDSALVDAKLLFREQALRELSAFFEQGDRLCLPAADDPVVSILVVLFNEAELTLRCLRSLIDTVDVPAEVIIVDNASSDATWRLLDRLDGARVIRNNEDRHFLRAVNQGSGEARGSALLLLNNDAKLMPGALQAALETLHSATNIGAVGGKLILPDGRLQEAGNIIWSDGTCAGYGRGQDPNAPEYQFQRDVDYCSGAFLLIRRDLFEKLGRLDDGFAPAYYEETDFCMRLRQAGYRIVYDPRVEVMHFEFATSSFNQAGALMQRNHKLFFERHQQVLAENHLPPNRSMLSARISNRRQPRLLLIDDQVPFPSYGSGFPRASRILTTLHKAGCFITYYPLLEPAAAWSDVYATFPREIEFMLGYGRGALGAFLEARAGHYDIIVVSRPHNMWDFIEQRDKDPGRYCGIKIIYDAEALYSPREAKRLELAGTPLSAAEQERLLHKEFHLARAADAVIAVNAREANLFKAAGLGSVHVLGHAIEPEPLAADFVDRQGFLFVGALDDDQAPNVDALFWFVDEVMPHLDRLIGAGYRVSVAGRGGAQRLRDLVNPRVEVLGRVEDLTQHYRRARVFVAPTRFAAGVPHKLHEAASRGLPAVATSILATQLGWGDGIELLVADTPEAFASQCARVHRDRALWQRLREAALLRVTADCDPTGFEASLARVVGSLGITVDNYATSAGKECPIPEAASRDERKRCFLQNPGAWDHSRPPNSTHGLDVPGLPREITPSSYHDLRRRIEEGRAARIATFGASPVSPVTVSDIDEALSALSFPISGQPKVSILIPMHNHFKLTLECLLSILRSEPRTAYEVIIGDNASTEEQVARLSQVPGIRYFRHERDLHFLRNCNAVFPHVRGRYLLLLNNDAQLLPTTLEKLVEALDRNPHVSAVGPSLLYPNGLLQEAGCSINFDASTKMVGLFDDPNLPVYNRTRQVHYCSAAALLIRVEALRGVLFDERFAPAYCEDADLCLRLQTTWGPILHVGEAKAVHHLSATNAEKSQRSKLTMISRNQQKFLEKWSEEIYEMIKMRVISFYLPQFHPIPENDLWWGTGFTEWTNVTRAVPSFEGHYQPHLPADLGFYDLRVSEIFEKQARLAARYCLEGFCVYYYRFGSRRILYRPLEVLSEHPEIDFRFCICWANENWTRRWDGGNAEILLAQDYSNETFEAFAADIASFVQDSRYIKVDERPLVVIYRPLQIPRTAEAMELIRCKVREAVDREIHLVYVESMEAFGRSIRPSDIGFDASIEFPPHGIGPLERIQPSSPRPGWEGGVYDYEEMVAKAVASSRPPYTRYPAVSPSWDNTPRRPASATVYHNATPEAFRVYVEEKIDEVHSFLTGDSRLLFVNAWNEWAEGTHLEPDQGFGHRWLEALRGALLAKGCV
jgi:GT2 family glycosyltransferase/glycosyltransferase involved in cell wall biosynthesis